MAKKLLALPLSARINIVAWLEGFRNSGLGLKQSTLDFFDQGNQYNTNAKIDLFNKKVEILVRALKASGEGVGKTPKGRHSITASMLNRFKIQHFTPELTALVFDSELAGLKFDSKTADLFMATAYKKNKDIEFNSLKYFLEFSRAGNFDALKWLAKTYGAKPYNMRSNMMMDAFDLLIKSTSEPHAVDLFMVTGILPLSVDFTYEKYTFVLNKLIALSEDSLTKILPVVKLGDEIGGYGLLRILKDLHTHHSNEKMIKLLNFSDGQIELIATEILNTIDKSHFPIWQQLIKDLVSIHPSMLGEMLQFTNSRIYDEIVSLVPEVRDIFLF